MVTQPELAKPFDQACAVQCSSRGTDGQGGRQDSIVRSAGHYTRHL